MPDDKSAREKPTPKPTKLAAPITPGEFQEEDGTRFQTPVAAPARPESAESARRFLGSRLEPDPNNPDEDTFVLHFPHAAELVECREFWARHLAELLSEYAAGELARLRAERDHFAKQNLEWAKCAEKHRLACDGLRDALRWVKDWFVRLEDGNEAGDPLRAFYTRYHAPVHAKIDSALAALPVTKGKP